MFNQNEGQYAGAAREMLNRPQDYLPSARRQTERGQLLVPTNDGMPRLQKPPLVYWTLIASMRLFGVNDFTARLPNALATLAWFAGIVCWAGGWWRRRGGGAAARHGGGDGAGDDGGDIYFQPSHRARAFPGGVFDLDVLVPVERLPRPARGQTGSCVWRGCSWGWAR